MQKRAEMHYREEHSFVHASKPELQDRRIAIHQDPKQPEEHPPEEVMVPDVDVSESQQAPANSTEDQGSLIVPDADNKTYRTVKQTTTAGGLQVTIEEVWEFY
jgi:hypothetical protein